MIAFPVKLFIFCTDAGKDINQYLKPWIVNLLIKLFYERQRMSHLVKRKIIHHQLKIQKILKRAAQGHILQVALENRMGTIS